MASDDFHDKNLDNHGHDDDDNVNINVDHDADDGVDHEMINLKGGGRSSNSYNTSNSISRRRSDANQMTDHLASGNQLWNPTYMANGHLG